MPLLQSIGLICRYGAITALNGIDIEVHLGEIVALVGANGAGKSTLLRTLSGLHRASAGQVLFCGREVTHIAANKRMRLGICHAPEGRQIFPGLSVRDNLNLGAFSRSDRDGIDADRDRMVQLFPILGEKIGLLAGTLSGGQQQMLAIARALMGRPKVLLLDEPSLGLAPLIVKEIFSKLQQLRAAGTTILMVEQNAAAALAIADRGYVLETGHLVQAGKACELLGNDEIRRAYLGG
jgi:branched-chain amino acid transport system ATP-binding protein